MTAVHASTGRGIADTGELFRTGRWQAILGAVGYLGFDIAAMVTAFAATGGVPDLPLIIFAYTIGQLGGIIPIPGGIGGTDGGLIGAAVLYGASLSQATAAAIATTPASAIRVSCERATVLIVLRSPPW